MAVNIGTLLGQAIAMFVFVWFCMKYIWPVIMNAIEQRQTEIANGLAAAEQGKADGEAARKSQLEAARAEIEVELNRAREELRGQVAKIAVAGAEKVLGREIDANAHRDLLGKLAAEL